MTVVGIQFVESQEKIRHNRALEELQAQEIGVKQYQADTARLSYGEDVRHNLVSEAQNMYNLESGRISAEANRKQAEVAAGRLNLDTYKYETSGKALEQSQTALNRAKAYESSTVASLNLSKVRQVQAETELTKQKTRSETVKAEASEKYGIQQALAETASSLAGAIESVQTVSFKTSPEGKASEYTKVVSGGAQAIAGIAKDGTTAFKNIVPW